MADEINKIDIDKIMSLDDIADLDKIIDLEKVADISNIYQVNNQDMELNADFYYFSGDISLQLEPVNSPNIYSSMTVAMDRKSNGILGGAYINTNDYGQDGAFDVLKFIKDNDIAISVDKEDRQKTLEDGEIYPLYRVRPELLEVILGKERLMDYFQKFYSKPENRKDGLAEYYTDRVSNNISREERYRNTVYDITMEYLERQYEFDLQRHYMEQLALERNLAVLNQKNQMDIKMSILREETAKEQLKSEQETYQRNADMRRYNEVIQQIEREIRERNEKREKQLEERRQREQEQREKEEQEREQQKHNPFLLNPFAPYKDMTDFLERQRIYYLWKVRRELVKEALQLEKTERMYMRV